MVVPRAELARFFLLGYLNFVGLFHENSFVGVGKALTNETVLNKTAYISTDFSFRASWEKGNVERLLVDGFAVLLEEMRLGDPEKIITGKRLKYIKRLGKEITLAMRPEEIPYDQEDPTEEIY